MKILKYFGIACLSAMLTFSLTACGNDEPEGGGDGIENGSGDDDDEDPDVATWSRDVALMTTMGDYTFTYGYGLHRGITIAPNQLYCTSISYKGKKILEIDYANSKLKLLGYDGKGSYSSDFDITLREGYIRKISGTESVNGSGNDYVKQASWVINEYTGTGDMLIQSVDYNETVTYTSGLVTSRIIKETYGYDDGRLETKHIDVHEDDGIFSLNESWICTYLYDNPSFPRTFQIPMAYTAGVYSAFQGTMRLLTLTGMFGLYGESLPSQMIGHYEFSNRGSYNYPEGYTALDDRPFEESWGFQYDNWYDEGAFEFEGGTIFRLFGTERNSETSIEKPNTYSYKFESKHVTGNDDLK